MEFIASTLRCKLKQEKLGDKAIKNMMQAFNFFDHDGNGEISKEELYEFLKANNPEMTEEIAEYMIQEVDINKDGSIQFEEFVKMMKIFDDQEEIVIPHLNKSD